MGVGPAPNVYAFIHIPKTGGTSFRAGLEARFQRIHRDYGRDRSTPLVDEALYGGPTDPPPDARAALLRKLLEQAASEPGEPIFLCGHIRYRNYRFADLGIPVCTFVREPVERVLSHYLSLRRSHGERRPLRQFVIEDQRVSDLQSRYLAGIGLDELAFLGTTARYGESVELFNRRTGFGIPALDINRARRSWWARMIRFGQATEKRVELDQETRELILLRNSRDVELYGAASALVEARLAEASIAG